MLTLGALRNEDDSGTQLTHHCKNPDCGCNFSHRPRGGNDFCSEKCRGSYDANARQVLHRLSSRREFIRLSRNAVLTLTYALQTRPSTPSARRDRTWRELAEL